MFDERNDEFMELRGKLSERRRPQRLFDRTQLELERRERTEVGWLVADRSYATGLVTSLASGH